MEKKKHIDLENDLAEILEEKIKAYLDVENPVEYMQKNKMKNMAELVKYLKEEDAKLIIKHENFKCLKGFYDEENSTNWNSIRNYTKY